MISLSLKLALQSVESTILNPINAALYFFDASAASSVTVANPGGSPLLVSSWASTAGANDIGRTLSQGVALNQPRYTGSNRITFADSSDVITFIPAVAQAGWQIVGTSRGTFAYRTNSSSQSAIRLLGHQSYLNLTGDLYGVILLPELSGIAVVDAARQILIDRGAAREVVGNNTTDWWRNRTDIVEFGHSNFSLVTTFQGSWDACSALTSFPLINTSSGTNFIATWRNCSSLTTFPLINTSNGTLFISTWNGCSSLVSFPLIDTSKGTSFQSSWVGCNKLTSFPLIDTSKGTSFNNTWNSCSSLTSFPLLDTNSGTEFQNAWVGCNKLVSFPLINANKGTNFSSTWNSCALLASFPAGFFDNWTGTPVANCFLGTWAGTTALTATSVENIFNSINTSGRSAPATGKEITVVYNAATGTPNITAAVTNLKSRGWTPRLNGTLL